MMKEQRPLVSILIPVYNQENLVRETLMSVFSQKYTNIEVLIGDDNSCDSTVEEVYSCISSAPEGIHCKVFCSSQNQGISANLNRLISEAKGEFISFLGGDDLMFADKLSKQIDFMLRNPECTICYHDMMLFDSDTQEQMHLYSKRHPPREGGVDMLIKYGSFNCGSSNIIRMKQKVYCDERIKFASDWLHFISCLEVNKGKICYLSECLGGYRRHSGNITQIRREQGFEEIILTIRLLEEKYRGKKRLINYVYAEKYFTYSCFLLKNKEYLSAMKLFVKGILKNPMGLLAVARNGYNYFKVKREGTI